MPQGRATMTQFLLTQPEHFNLKPYEIKIVADESMPFFVYRITVALSVNNHEANKKTTQENNRDSIIPIHSDLLFLQDGQQYWQATKQD